MKFGFQLMSRGIGGTVEGISALASKGEEFGFDCVALNDHIVVPGDIDSRYPYTHNGDWPGAAVGECHEVLTMLAFVAARTSTIRLLTSVMVVPHRDPVLTAKILSTADVLSAGRLTVGCGAGWMKEELEAIGVPPFAERGKVTDEYIEIFKELWCAESPKFDGQYAQFSEVLFSPRPVQKPHPPIWIGGESKAALRRVVRLGDGWYPASNNPTFPVHTPELLAERLAVLHGMMEEAGRDPATLDVGYFYLTLADPKEQLDRDGKRRPMTGAASDVAADIAAFGAAGVKNMILIFQQPELNATLDRMEWFARDVRPLISA